MPLGLVCDFFKFATHRKHGEEAVSRRGNALAAKTRSLHSQTPQRQQAQTHFEGKKPLCFRGGIAKPL